MLELLIAVSIIAIISAVGFSTFSQSQMRGRDAKRKQDLRSIAVALELYYQKNGHYPCSSSFITSVPLGWWITNDASISTSCASGSSLPFTSNYISKLPIDPLKNVGEPRGGSFGYEYWAGNDGASCVAGQYYLLAALLENSNDPETIGKAGTIYYCVNALFTGGPNWNANSFVIQSK